MAEEATNIQAVTTASDGTVKLAIEKYNELVEKIASQKETISNLNSRLSEARTPVINRTEVIKTAEMVAEDHRVWGATFMGTGAILFGIGVFRLRAGRTKS
jgi:hypothetical protein